MIRQIQKKTINQDHKDVNSKTKQSTRTKKTQTENNQPGTIKTPNTKQNIQQGI
jgi:hypothetical protein